MQPLEIEVIAHTPTVFFHCQHCEMVWTQTGFSRGVRAEQVRSGLPDDMQREYAALSDWVHRLIATYRDRVDVKVIDAGSIGGLWRSLRHRIHRYPAIVVAGRETFAGTELGSAEAAIARRLTAASIASAQDTARASHRAEEESRR